MSDDIVPPLRPCSVCGEEKPYTAEYFIRNSAKPKGLGYRCRKCQSEIGKARYAKDPEKARARVREYHEKNREREREKARIYRIEHKQEADEAVKRYRAKDPVKANERSRQWHRENPERNRLNHSRYLRNNPGKNAEYHNRRRAQQLSLPNAYTTQQWQRAINYFGGCCAVCGRPPGLWHRLAQDHWVPLTKGGGTTVDNIVPLCHGDLGCNNSKWNHDAEKWLTERFGKAKAKQKLKEIEAYFEWAKEQ